MKILNAWTMYYVPSDNEIGTSLGNKYVFPTRDADINPAHCDYMYVHPTSFPANTPEESSALWHLWWWRFQLLNTRRPAAGGRTTKMHPQ